MDYNFWDDRTYALYCEEGIHPCAGCCDFNGDECISKGACADVVEEKIKEKSRLPEIPD